MTCEAKVGWQRSFATAWGPRFSKGVVAWGAPRARECKSSHCRTTPGSLTSCRCAKNPGNGGIYSQIQGGAHRAGYIKRGRFGVEPSGGILLNDLLVDLSSYSDAGFPIAKRRRGTKRLRLGNCKYGLHTSSCNTNEECSPDQRLRGYAQRPFRLHGWTVLCRETHESVFSV